MGCSLLVVLGGCATTVCISGLYIKSHVDRYREQKAIWNGGVDWLGRPWRLMFRTFSGQRVYSNLEDTQFNISYKSIDGCSRRKIK